MLDYSTFTATLTNNPELPLIIKLPDQRIIPSHFHLRDVGLVNRYFIDCHGNKKETNHILLQAWVGHDHEHSIDSRKFAKILSHSEKVEKVFDRIPDLASTPILIEYQEDHIMQYLVSGVEAQDNKIVISTTFLKIKHFFGSKIR